ncbi:hypothetical protein BD324DRAFT_311338 [Kockovaella imperatae]|uniref:Uncharacterized protein n=1 Tax=Kockovaella imperatae TaxID=4999 RepID=A0A1Y1UNN9_9TREE|nr:hypothetical protein BD324DRAFT_311338 [Kockovaella imperatae]ORX39114.1 hypothetical protein BD324DRAFT_311338 [Kockovaella imperatae]
MSLSIIAVDDFDPLIGYSNYDDWSTPDPQDHPTWWNATSDVTGVPWYEATYHYTTVKGATVYFNFTGSSLAIYGASGPDTANYTIKIDPDLPQPFSQSYSTSNATGNGRTLLYSTDQLAYAAHQVQIINDGSGLLLDMIEFGVELAAEGTTTRAYSIRQTGPSRADQTSPAVHPIIRKAQATRGPTHLRAPRSGSLEIKSTITDSTPFP